MVVGRQVSSYRLLMSCWTPLCFLFAQQLLLNGFGQLLEPMNNFNTYSTTFSDSNPIAQHLDLPEYFFQRDLHFVMQATYHNPRSFLTPFIPLGSLPSPINTKSFRSTPKY